MYATTYTLGNNGTDKKPPCYVMTVYIKQPLETMVLAFDRTGTHRHHRMTSRLTSFSLCRCMTPTPHNRRLCSHCLSWTTRQLRLCMIVLLPSGFAVNIVVFVLVDHAYDGVQLGLHGVSQAMQLAQRPLLGGVEVPLKGSQALFQCTAALLLCVDKMHPLLCVRERAWK